MAKDIEELTNESENVTANDQPLESEPVEESEELENETDFDEEVPEDEVPNFLDILFQNSEQTVELLRSLDKKFEAKIKVDAHKAEMFDNMHKELTAHKNGLVTQVINNILVDVIQLIDANNKTIDKFETEEATEENYNKLLNALKGISEDLQDILYRQSVEPYTIDDTVDVKKQKIIQVIPTDDEKLDRTIAAHIAPGYEKDGKVIRPERIAIYRLK